MILTFDFEVRPFMISKTLDFSIGDLIILFLGDTGKLESNYQSLFPKNSGFFKKLFQKFKQFSVFENQKHSMNKTFTATTKQIK
jgi:hypothetical protein